jgi:hypothetical protein
VTPVRAGTCQGNACLNIGQEAPGFRSLLAWG